MKREPSARRRDLNRDFLTYRFARQSVAIFRFNMKLELRSLRWRPAVDLLLEQTEYFRAPFRSPFVGGPDSSTVARHQRIGQHVRRHPILFDVFFVHSKAN